MTWSRSIKKTTITKLIGIILSVITNSYAQPKPEGFHAEVYLLTENLRSYTAGIDKSTANARSIDQVRNYVLKTIDAKDGEIVIRFVNNEGKINWWRHYFGKPAKSVKGYIAKGTRGLGGSNIYQADGFKMLFKDTIAILDTITFRTFLDPESYVRSGFTATLNCPSEKTSSSISLTCRDGNEVVLASENMLRCTTNYLQCKLTHSGQKDDILASFYLIRIPEDVKKEIRGIIERGRGKKLDPNRLQEIVQEYVTVFYGHPDRADLKRWIEKS